MRPKGAYFAQGERGFDRLGANGVLKGSPASQKQPALATFFTIGKSRLLAAPVANARSSLFSGRMPHVGFSGCFMLLGQGGVMLG